MDTTLGKRKSHSRSGWRNGATNPPDAASMWTGVASPVASLLATMASWMSLMGSYSPVDVVPRMAMTPMVFSSVAATAASSVMTYWPFVMGTYRGSTSQ